MTEPTEQDRAFFEWEAEQFAAAYQAQQDKRDALMQADMAPAESDPDPEVEHALELLNSYDILPCNRCWGIGLIPAEAFGCDADGAPMQDEEQPCPEGCPLPSWLVAERNDNRCDREEIEKLRADNVRLQALCDKTALAAGNRTLQRLVNEGERAASSRLLDGDRP